MITIMIINLIIYECDNVYDYNYDYNYDNLYARSAGALDQFFKRLKTETFLDTFVDKILSFLLLSTFPNSKAHLDFIFDWLQFAIF